MRRDKKMINYGYRDLAKSLYSAVLNRLPNFWNKKRAFSSNGSLVVVRCIQVCSR